MSSQTINGLILSAAAAMLTTGCERGSSGEAQAAVAFEANVPTVRSASQTAGQQLPPEVGRWVQSVRAECAEAGGRWVGISDFLLRGDFNGDGRTDYLPLREAANCPATDGGASGAMERLWGNGGPFREFLISQADGSYRLYDGFNRVPELVASDIVRRGDRDVVAIPGTWSGTGSEIRKVIWGWTGQGIAVIERQDAQGRSVDEDGNPIRAAHSGAPSALPFQEGRYAVACGASFDDGENLTITASEFISENLADTDSCRVDSREIKGNRVQLIIRCEAGCGNGHEGECPVEYGPPRTLVVSAESKSVINITGGAAYWNGRRNYCGPASG